MSDSSRRQRVIRRQFRRVRGPGDSCFQGEMCQTVPWTTLKQHRLGGSSPQVPRALELGRLFLLCPCPVTSQLRGPAGQGHSGRQDQCSLPGYVETISVGRINSQLPIQGLLSKKGTRNSGPADPGTLSHQLTASLGNLCLRRNELWTPSPQLSSLSAMCRNYFSKAGPQIL